jgi:hypothetical protein
MINSVHLRTIVTAFTLSTCAIQAAAQGPRVQGTVLATGSGRREVDKVGIYVYRIEGDRTEEILGFSKQPTEQSGKFDFTCDEAADRVAIWITDEGPKPKRFDNFQIWPLSGRNDVVLFPALVSIGELAVETRRSTMRQVASIASSVSPKDLPWVEPYLDSVISELPSNPRLQYGSELNEAIAGLRGTGSSVDLAATGEYVAIGKQGGDATIKVYNTPRPSPGRAMFLETEAVVPISGDGEDIVYPNFLVPNLSGPLVVRNSGKLGWNGHSQAGSFTGGDRLDWSSHTASGRTTSAAGVALHSLQLKGTEAGAVAISRNGKSTQWQEFAIGRTPVVATALSNDGRRFAGATIDGEFGVWEITAPEMLTAKKITGGRLPVPFPVTMAFAADGRSLVIGTGLGKRHNAVAAIDLRPSTLGKIDVWECPATVTQVGFGTDPTKMLASASNGTTYVLGVRLSEAGIKVEKEDFAIRNIDAFGFLPQTDAAILKVRGKDSPLLVPISSLFNEATVPVGDTGLKVEK